jgi:hypothetical protein
LSPDRFHARAKKLSDIGIVLHADADLSATPALRRQPGWTPYRMENTAMSDEAHDPIDVTQAGEVQYWCERLGVSEHALRQAVADVGPRVEQVAVHLGKQ